DTTQQKFSLAYINSLEYDNITVTGHSKGGNKAMYVAILSDKVDRCMSLEGQGFNDKFCEKYEEEIAKNKYKIKSIASSSGFLCGDPVKGLLIPIAGTEEYREKAIPIGLCEFKKYHRPDSIIKITKDENGNIVKVELAPVTREGLLTKLINDFTTYFLENVEDEDERILLARRLLGLFKMYYPDLSEEEISIANEGLKELFEKYMIDNMLENLHKIILFITLVKLPGINILLAGVLTIVISKVIKILSDKVPILIEKLKNGIEGIKQKVYQKIEGIMEEIAIQIDNLIAIAKAIEKFAGNVKNIITSFINNIKIAWENLKSSISSAWESLKSGVSDAWEDIKSGASEAWEDIKSGVSDAWEDVKSGVSDAWEDIKSGVSDAWEGIKSGVSDTWEGIKSGVSDTWEGIKGKLQSIADGFKEFSEKVGYNTQTLSIVMENILNRNMKETQEEITGESIGAVVGSISALVGGVGAENIRKLGEIEKEEIPEEVEILCDVTKMASTGRAYYSGK
ncbi:Mbeg1-like protein, partial [Defluviitalea phaphyphila]|uniref:Mbeg1-like protein n=1 Tax=Defluviitalea phaphyphila TaxID=1473580 RepID=UPI001365D774